MQVLKPPHRSYDSRESSIFLAGETRTIPLGVGTPMAAEVNLIVVTPLGNGYLSVWGSGARPLASAVNYSAGYDNANAVITEVSNGSVQIYAHAVCHLVVDVYAVWP